ncbi:Uncharacterised protein [Burkholderia pseudomallei]|nr:Uncharacterised protein [Burkholderia pseudomallei]CAJ4174105.1 Uncharacterised protein [Burkholderia pseudomallei]CAJ4616115.1 Uncharacterised protein [Burkholderia pseudomallei]CAJ5598316.1 Uncharacterised protein [Burkholderia pseudomallei]CAJ6081493.1 Uncharacterised protein [Burkholderia pseudomallei]
MDDNPLFPRIPGLDKPRELVPHNYDTSRVLRPLDPDPARRIRESNRRMFEEKYGFCLWPREVK